MFADLPLFPEQASSVAGRVDALFFFLVGLSVFFSLLVATLVIVFAIRYRRRSEGEVGASIHGSLPLELVWTGIPLVLAVGIFFWGASVYFTITRAPADAMDIYVVGKQWMWKIQHPDGRREINELHVPVGRPVRLTMGSEDVIHDFFIPAFRVKADVVPGRTTTLWFEATKPGRYHLFCAEYCGTQHSGMGGWVVAMEPADYQAWLSGGAGQESLASAGERLFQDLACNTCHLTEGQGRGPSLTNVFGRLVLLQGGRTITADEAYVRESIVNPRAKTVEGYELLMPTFQGIVSEEGLMQLIAYIKSLSDATSEPNGENEPVAAETGAQAAGPTR